METNVIPPPSPSIDIGDIYYTLFRHKWKIIICTLLGFAGAVGYRKLNPPPFESDAELFIIYVVSDGKSATAQRDDTVTKTIDQRGETIISGEKEILSSLDLAVQVAKVVGPEKILAKIGGGRDLMAAAATVSNGLVVTVQPKSSVLHLAFQHPDAEVVQPVLKEYISAYLKKHLEVHRSGSIIGDSLTAETDQLRAKLSQTEDDLRKTMNKANIISLEDFKKTSSEYIAKIRQQIFDIKAELAERTSYLQEMTKDNPGTSSLTAGQPGVPQDQIEAHAKISLRVELFRKREQDLLVSFTEENSRVKDVRARLAEAEDQKKKLETQYPSLARLHVATVASAGSGKEGNKFDPATSAIQIISLQAKIKELNSQLDEVYSDAAKVSALEVSILELRRRQSLDESNYRYYAASVEQNRINEALGEGHVSNISTVETPTPPSRDFKKNTMIAGAIGVCGAAFGLAWAFLIELLLDRSVRRPSDIELGLRLPLFLSIPKIHKKRNLKQLGSRVVNPALPAPSADSPVPTNGQLALARRDLSLMPGGSDAALDPFYETLRDRLISYFESINLRHKPKLVAMTGLGKGAGVTTLAAGLARSFSETGEGNVLLVDMTQGQGSAHHFHKGKTICGLDELLDTTNTHAKVQDNLYVVGETSSSERLAKGIPQRFSQLVPKLKTSDFDYIIFDMPPVNQISITPRLASFMDMVMLVIESEKSDRDIAQMAATLLSKSKTSVGVVLNKTKSYIPASLHQDRQFLIGT